MITCSPKAIRRDLFNINLLQLRRSPFLPSLDNIFHFHPPLYRFATVVHADQLSMTNSHFLEIINDFLQSEVMKKSNHLYV